MDKVNPLNTTMMGITLNIDNDPFIPKEGNEEDIGFKVPCLSVIGHSRALLTI